MRRRSSYRCARAAAEIINIDLGTKSSSSRPARRAAEPLSHNLAADWPLAAPIWLAASAAGDSLKLLALQMVAIGLLHLMATRQRQRQREGCRKRKGERGRKLRISRQRSLNTRARVVTEMTASLLLVGFAHFAFPSFSLANLGQLHLGQLCFCFCSCLRLYLYFRFAYPANR